MAPKVSGKAVKKAGKAQKKPTGDKKKKKKRRETYSLYIYKVLKQVHGPGPIRFTPKFMIRNPTKKFCKYV